MVWSGADRYRNATRRKWVVDGELAGYVRSVDNLSDVLVRNAGHMVPTDQPKWAFELFNNFVHNPENFVNPKLEKANAPVDIYDIREIGEPGLSFDEALARFKAMMQGGGEEGAEGAGLEAKQRAVCRDLEATFGHLLPGVQAKLFGSSQIGLRLKDSDTDIFMDCPSGQPQRNFVQKYGSLMFDNKYFEKVVKIATARVPIVTFNHVETGLLCDVTFLNKLGLKNSEMLKFLLSLDPRIRNLALIVKYWAKVHELSGIGNFSNYALTFMVVFYLQQLDEPLVPSVYLLQQLADRKEVCENWECSFCSDVSKLPKITNKSTTKELLWGFFDYWARFDYDRYVAVPLLGRTIKKADFKDFENLPDELERYKRHAREVEVQLEAEKALNETKKQEQKAKNKNQRSKLSWYEKNHVLNVDLPVCIQDAFDLSYNIARMIRPPLLVRFQWLCEYARDEVLTNEEGGKVLLDVFLPPLVKPPEAVSQEFTNQKDVYMDQFHIPGVNPEEERYKAVWYIVVRLSVVYILTHVYCFELEMDDSNESKAIMSSEKFDSTDRVYRTVCMKMKGASAVFERRNAAKKRLVLSSDAFNNDCIVSRESINFLKHSAPKNYRGGDMDKIMGYFTMKIRFFCFPDEQRPRLMLQFINCKSQYFNVVTAGLTGLLCSSFQRGMTKCISENDLPIAEYLKSGGGDWNDLARYFEEFVKDCNEKSRKLCDDPKFAIVYQKAK
ncbi:hypothetical protein LSTR_LSTR007757 [Laodelphax striatellus]|uniref:Poly(A) RNA polymerase mitochondrial-like central palm domain-containing protein n=1 Tax=Laodelphax striatellus TaxID=195883 RepID=A0A482XSL7_LAOST|nr:hypothetical protein LSTR_LSTR007757 [Laodelphax striatellus]